MIMRNANAIRAIAAWHFSKRTAVGGSYVNTFNFLVLPLGVFHFQIHYWPVSQSASLPPFLGHLHVSRLLRISRIRA